MGATRLSDKWRVLAAGLVSREGRRFPFGKCSRPRKPSRIGPQAQCRPTETVAGHVEGRGHVIVGERWTGVGMSSETRKYHTWCIGVAIGRPIEIVVGRDHVVPASEPEGTGGGARGVDFEEGDEGARMENGRRFRSARSARPATCEPMGGGEVGSHECNSSGNPPMTPWREGRAIAQRGS